MRLGLADVCSTEMSEKLRPFFLTKLEILDERKVDGGLGVMTNS